MRRLVVVLLVAACGGEDKFDSNAPHTFEWGPYRLAPGEEIEQQCISVTLHNDEPMYVNAVSFASGPGFHHSNWFVVPEYKFPGPDGTWDCDARDYNEALAGFFGSVLFAQSTQSKNEAQAFAPGMAIVVPPHWKIVAGTHLLNAADTPVDVSLSLTINPIPAEQVTTQLNAMSWDNRALGLPPHRTSSFTFEPGCDIVTDHQRLLSRAPDFKIHYALAHYHQYGARMLVEAVRGDGTAATIFDTEGRVGDALGGKIDPPFSMTGFASVRTTCVYENNTDRTISWGLGKGEMCTFLGFTDSPYSWGGGALDVEPPGMGTDVGTQIDFTHSCIVIPVDGSHL